MSDAATPDVRGDCERLLGPAGAFAQQLDGFVARAQQLVLADAIGRAIFERGHLLAEAGTGTGKTFAYLVPTLLSGARAIISTGTKALQDQLFQRDLPRVRKLLQSRSRIALLKGRANYLCLHRLDRAAQEMRFESREQVGQFAKIRTWAAKTPNGDRNQCESVPENASIWPLVTSTTDNCLGKDCPHFDQCWLVKARRQAMESDVVVVNHSLLLADMAMRSEGFGEVLPGAQVLIIDEAHQLPETASNHFGKHFSARQVTELVRDTMTEAGQVSGAARLLQEHLAHCDLALKKLRLSLDGFPIKGAFGPVAMDPEVHAAIAELGTHLVLLQAQLEALKEGSTGMENVASRATDLLLLLDLFRSPEGLAEVRWYELSQSGFALHSTPLEVADSLASFRSQSGATWVLTSATLAVGDSFAHFQRESGMLEAHTLKVDSPFDYASQALLYLPTGLPEPNEPGYTGRVVELATPALRASQGRAFMLFTSHRALNEAANQLRFAVDYPLFVQGTAPRNKLLRDFIESGNGVLLGAATFWEGVDVPGEALSLVIIDKLPFAQIGDPVTEARLGAIRENGGNPFMDYQLPAAVLALKQGVGRLIRTVEDRGVLMLCDPRLRTRRYGRSFLDALPAMTRSSRIEDVELFFRVQPSA